MEKLGIRKKVLPVADEITTARHVRMPHEKPYWPVKERGVLVKSYGEYTLNIEYRKLPGYGKGLIMGMLANDPGASPKMRQEIEEYSGREYMQIVNLSILDKEGNARFLLSRDLPGYCVDLTREHPQPLPFGENFINYEAKHVVLAGDINNLDTIATLLHEVGHYVYRSQMTSEKKEMLSAAKKRYDKYRVMTSEDHGLIMENERMAWAFALGILRPLLNRDERKFLVRRLHDFALRSYKERPVTSKSNNRLEIEYSIGMYLGMVRRFFGYSNRSDNK
jgi:hypothetical protein